MGETAKSRKKEEVGDVQLICICKFANLISVGRGVTCLFIYIITVGVHCLECDYLTTTQHTIENTVENCTTFLLL